MKDGSRFPGLWGATFGQIVAAVKALDTFGLAPADLERVASDPEFASRLAHCWRAGAEPIIVYAEPPSQKRAREILARNFHGITDVIRYFSAAYTEEQLGMLAEVPFTEETLRECRETHVLFPGYPLSLLDICAKQAHLFFSKTDWYQNEPFARDEKVTVRWYLLRRDLRPDSAYKGYPEQVALLSGREELPRACEVVYMVTLHYLATRERLLKDTYVRCADQRSTDEHVQVGAFGSGQLGIYHRTDGARDWNFGLASARKPDTSP